MVNQGTIYRSLSFLDSISGTLSAVDNIDGILSEVGSLEGTLSGYTSGLPYSGAYEVTPMVNDEVKLSTAGRTLAKDLIVLKVPSYETSNLGGGNTFYIGE